ncbi:MAG: hypothetical protein ACYC0Q_05960 [Eubacteriales bacterium]
MAVEVTEVTFNPVKKIKFEWVSDAAGAATGPTTKIYSGQILRLVTIPGTAANQPTDLYDVVIRDGDSVDVLAGTGANRSNVNVEQVLAASLGAVGNDKLSLEVSNAGNTKSGGVILYLR